MLSVRIRSSAITTPNQMNAASDLVSPEGMVWLDMGLIRGVPLQDVEVRAEPDQA